MKKIALVTYSLSFLFPFVLQAQVLSPEEVQSFIQEQLQNVQGQASTTQPTAAEIEQIRNQILEETRARINEGNGITNSTTNGVLTITPSPQFPAPGKTVTLSIEGSGIDLYSSTITWVVNGKTEGSGKGLKIFSTTVGEIGSSKTVTARVNSNGETLVQNITLVPREVDLFWQGNGYTPAFYSGRTLWSKQSRVTVMAIPQGIGNSNPNSLIYRWAVNNTVLGSASGVGKNTLSLSDDILSSTQTIKVDVMSNQNTVVASKTIKIAPANPSLVVYENNPLYGFMFHRQVTNTYLLGESEVTLAGFPFFFSTTNRDSSNLKYKWQGNSTNQGETSAITYRAPQGASGTSLVSLNLSSPDFILQSAQNSFLVQFGDNDQQ